MSHRRILWNAKGNKEGELILLAMKAKGLAFFTNVDSASGGLILSDHGTTVKGFFPIIEFINDKYPEPSLIFTDPTEKAIVRMFVLDLVNGGAYENNNDAKKVLTDLASELSPQSFLLGSKPSLVDLAVIPLIEDGDVTWQPFKQKVLKAIAA